MVSAFGRLVALVALFAPAFAAPTADHPKIRSPDMSAQVIPNSYIVIYHNDVNATMRHTHMAAVTSMIARRGLTGVGAQWDMSLLKGYQVTADAAAIAEIAALPEIDYVERNAKVYASALTTQTGATWGLGRVSHKLQGSTSYIYDSTAGTGTKIYVVDTGIYIGHSQFGGRAVWGANFVTGSANTDENGHGTHCAGTIAGTAYGVSKKAGLVAVKVLGADGSGTNAGVISGIQWVGTNAVSGKSVLSMSLGGGYSAALNTAVRSTIANGVTVVVAAGNDNANAANYSPASEALAITVGAIDINDNRASFSNYGTLVDVFAPGVGVLSSWIGSTSATNTISGTSMACPHVAGLAAYLISLEGLTTPAAVQARIKAIATSGKVISPNGSPNLIAYNGNGA